VLALQVTGKRRVDLHVAFQAVSQRVQRQLASPCTK
jgi:hypothetical protein